MIFGSKGSSSSSTTSSTKSSSSCTPTSTSFSGRCSNTCRGVASSHLSLEEEIDKFHFEEEQSPRAPLICISDTEGELDRSSGVHNPYLILTRPDNLDEEEDSMVNKGNKSLRDLLAASGKESTSKIAPMSQVAPPPPPKIPLDLSLRANPDLKKKMPVDTLEEGEVGP